MERCLSLKEKHISLPMLRRYLPFLTMSTACASTSSRSSGRTGSRVCTRAASGQAALHAADRFQTQSLASRRVRRRHHARPAVRRARPQSASCANCCNTSPPTRHARGSWPTTRRRLGWHWLPWWNWRGDASGGRYASRAWFEICKPATRWSLPTSEQTGC